MKMEFCGKPLITLISSMSLELISLNTYMVHIDSALQSYIVRNQKKHHYSVLFLVLYSRMLNQGMTSSFLPSFSYLWYFNLY
jgi:hypothetical protein